MPKEPIKISELTPATSLLGFATLGYKMVDGEKTSVQLDLSHDQTAYENTVEATRNATEAAGKANKAATDADNKMTQMSKEVNQALADVSDATAEANVAAGEADQARISLAESVQQKLAEVDNKMLTVQDGKTPQIAIGTVTPGSTPSASLTDDGVDIAGNP